MNGDHHRHMTLTGVPLWRACLGDVYIPVATMSQIYRNPAPLDDGVAALEQWMLEALLMARGGMGGVE
jgi:hypothetical protein